MFGRIEVLYRAIKAQIVNARILKKPPVAEREIGVFAYLSRALFIVFSAPGYDFRSGKNKLVEYADAVHGKPKGKVVRQQFKNADAKTKARYILLCAIEWPYPKETWFQDYPYLEQSLGGADIEKNGLFYFLRLPRILMTSISHCTAGVALNLVEIAAIKIAFAANRRHENVTPIGWFAAGCYGLVKLADMAVKCATEPLRSYRTADKINPLLGYISALTSISIMGTAAFYLAAVPLTFVLPISTATYCITGMGVYLAVTESLPAIANLRYYEGYNSRNTVMQLALSPLPSASASGSESTMEPSDPTSEILRALEARRAQVQGDSAGISPLGSSLGPPALDAAVPSVVDVGVAALEAAVRIEPIPISGRRP